MTTAVITGARGRIATALLPMLYREFDRVVCVSRVGGNGFLTWEEAFQANLWSKVESIIHCAWSTVPKISEANPGIEWDHDIPLLSRLLDGIAPAKKAPHFVFLSSAGTVYGPAREVPSREDDELAPIGWYGRAKVAAEVLVTEFAHRSGLPALLLRVSNPYGPSFDQQRPQGVVAAAIDSALGGSQLSVWGDGSALKDYLHTDDLEAACCRILQIRLTGTRNLCFGKSHSLREVIAIIEGASNRRISKIHLDAPPWDVKRSLVDRSRLSDQIDWQPVVTLEEGIRRSVEARLRQIRRNK